MMKLLILKHTKLYLLLCWLILWTAGSLIGLPVAINTLLILVIGYFANVIWLMRLTSINMPQPEKVCRSKVIYSHTIIQS